jgi:hypothetical protein
VTLPDSYSAQWPRQKLKGVAPGTHVFGLVTDIPLEEAAALVRSWGAWMEPGGVVRIAHTPTVNEAEFRKRRRGVAKGYMVFRLRNDGVSRSHFGAVLTRFQAAGVQYELELTPKLRRQRAIRVALDVPQELVPLR